MADAGEVAYKRRRTEDRGSDDRARLESRASLDVPDDADAENEPQYYGHSRPIVPRSDLVGPLNSLNLSCLSLAAQLSDAGFAIAGPSFLAELLKKLVDVTNRRPDGGAEDQLRLDILNFLRESFLGGPPGPVQNH